MALPYVFVRDILVNSYTPTGELPTSQKSPARLPCGPCLLTAQSPRLESAALCPPPSPSTRLPRTSHLQRPPPLLDFPRSEKKYRTTQAGAFHLVRAASQAGESGDCVCTDCLCDRCVRGDARPIAGIIERETAENGNAAVMHWPS